MGIKKKTRNPFEAKLQRQIVRSKIPFSYETERIEYVIVGNYIPDFILQTSSGKIYIEAKGYFRREAKVKMVAIKKQYPDLDIRIVFYKPNKTYAKWALKYGFPYSFETIPKDWLQ